MTGAPSWLVEFFTDDAVFVDPAWGRVEGLEAIEGFLRDSMTGIEDWTFPVDRIYVDGDEVIVKFRYEEDVLNMAHLHEDLRALHWQPPDGNAAPAPPAEPRLLAPLGPSSELATHSTQICVECVASSGSSARR